MHDIVAFVSVARAGTFTSAARDMHVPKSSLSRRVARLEQRLGAQLLQRTTRSLTLTEAGEVFHSRAAAALDELSAAASLAAETRRVPRGRVRMAAPQDVGAEVLPEIIASFTERHPEVRVEIDLTSDEPDIVIGRYDLVLRIGAGGASSNAVRLQDTRFRVYASPRYLERAGAIERIGDLSNHECIVVRGASAWHLERRGRASDIEVCGQISTNDLTFARRAAIAGGGLVLLPDLVGNIEAQRGALACVLPDFHARGMPLWLELPWTRYVPLRVGALRDHLVDTFPQ